MRNLRQIIEIHSFCAIAGLNIMGRDEGQRGEEIWLVGEIMEHQIQRTKGGLASRQRELGEGSVESQHATFPLTIDASPLHAIALAYAAVFHSICPRLISPARLPPSLWEQADVRGMDGHVRGDVRTGWRNGSPPFRGLGLAKAFLVWSILVYSSLVLCFIVHSSIF